MIHRRTQAFLAAVALLFCGLIPASIYAQTPAISHTIVVLDPAHGGADTGAQISDKLEEKDLNLAFAARLRPLLAAAGFNVIATRDADPAPSAQPLTSDLRAGIANHPHALACILIHAAPSGSGVHIFTSTLPPNNSDPNAVLSWDSAQSAYLSLSLRLANKLGVAFLHANIPPLLNHASIRPLDNLTCPAVAIELSPLSVSSAGPTPLTNAAYQQHIAQAIVSALISWRNEAAPLPAQPATNSPKSPAPSVTKPATAPASTPPPAPAAPAPTPTPAVGASK